MLRLSALTLTLVGLVLAVVPAGAQKDDKKKEDKAPSAVSPDGRLFATAKDRTIDILEAATQRTVARIQGHRDAVTTLAFSPDGKLLASGSRDKSVNLWDMPTGRQLRRFQLADTVVNLNFSQDGRKLTSHEADKTVREWDIATGKELKKSKEK